MTTPTSDVLGVLTRADRVWAAKRRASPATPEYLVHLAASLGGELLSIAAEAERLKAERDVARDQVRRLVRAVTGRWGRLRDVERQVVEALRDLARVQAYLESQREREAAA